MKHITKYLLAFLIFNSTFLITHAQVAINKNGNNPDNSAMLDISSNDKGLLIPRMDSTSRNSITNPAEGLMVFDSTTNSFWYYITDWIEIGRATLLTDTDGDTRITVEKGEDDDIIRFDLAGTEFMRLDSGRMEILNTGSSVFIGEGAGANDDFSNNKNVFIGYEVGHSNTTGIFNLFQGYRAGYSNETGETNIFLGYQTGYENISGNSNLFVGYNAGYDNTSGRENIFLGYTSGRSNITGRNNVFLGNSSGYENTTGTNNVFLGYLSGYENTIGVGNVAIGTFAGYQNKTGINNVFIGYEAGYYETDSSKLYIENSNSTTPLIYGDFATDSLQINGKLNINGAFNFPTTDGLANQVLSTDGNGELDWATNNGAFNSENGVTTSINNDDDFVFGADSLNYGSGTETKFFLDKETGAFRAGAVGDTNWDQDSLGTYSIALGLGTKATASKSVAIGPASSATDDSAISMGSFNEASGSFSNAFGHNNTASGGTSNAFGSFNTASGSFSSAFGISSEASGNTSTAVGYLTKAEGNSSTALGYSSTASGFASTALGVGSNAKGYFSTTLGRETNAYSFGEIAIGILNTAYTPVDTSNFAAEDRLFVIGNGTSNNNRSDALRIYKNGNMELFGTLTIDSAYTFPIEDGTNNQVLTTNGNGELTWSEASLTDVVIDSFNILIGIEAGFSRDYANNLFLGNFAGFEDSDGEFNTFIGHHAGFNTTRRNGRYDPFRYSSANNVFLGYNTGYSNREGNNNLYLGFEAGYTNTDGNNNIFIGHQAAYNETGSHKLYIESSNTTNPLIYGDFSADYIQINGVLHIKDEYTFPVTDGTVDQVLATDGSGNVSWVNPTASTDNQMIDTLRVSGTTLAISLEDDNEIEQTVDLSTIQDNLGDHTATQNLKLSNNWLSNDGNSEGISIDNDGKTTFTNNLVTQGNWISNGGDDEGIRIDDDGNVGVGVADPSEKLEVDGTVAATAFVGDGSGLTNLPNQVPVGTIQMWPTSTAPDGWLICNGGTFNTSTYPELNSVLGGNTLPNFNGRFPLGVGNSGTTGSTSHSIKSTGGEEQHVLTINEMPAHSHNITYGERSKGGSGNNVTDLDSSGKTETTSSTGGNQAHNNMPPFYTINFIIKAE